MQFLMVDVYYEKEICYSDNINKKQNIDGVIRWKQHREFD